MTTAAPATPLVVDLDDCLIVTDVLHESFVALALSRPLDAVGAVVTLFGGRAALKARLAASDAADIDALPLRADLVQWLRDEAQRGRQLHLVSASDQEVVRRIAGRIGIFAGYCGSDGTSNLKGQRKADYLAARFPDGFAYAGDSRSDLPVWRAARSIVLAGASSATSRAAESLGKPIEARFPDRRTLIPAIWKQMRPHQWVKNLLAFFPLLLAHRFGDTHAWLFSGIAFAALCLAISGTYILNDLADLGADRRHPTKSRRPIASGALPIRFAAILAPALIVAGLALAATTRLNAVLVVGLYVALTMSYSIRLKRIALWDTMVIGILFTLRVISGSAATGIPATPWLLAFSALMFTSLALAKRQTEIASREAAGDVQWLAGRGYRVSDGILTLVFGVSCSSIALVVLMLYVTTSAGQGLYRHGEWLWAILPLIYLWQARIWLLAHRGLLGDDPVVFALRDRTSLVLAAGCVAAFCMAL